MLYFAELYGKSVTSNDVYIGRLTDVVFLSTGQPLITKLVVKAKGEDLIVPMTAVSSINGSILLKPEHPSVPLSENELTLRTHLLDQQIIDINGNKVVRVNDVAIQEKPYFIVAGVDVGVLGIARWFKLEQVLNRTLSRFGKIVTSNFLAWENIQPVELSRGKVVVRHEETKLMKLRPEDLADHLERLSLRNLKKILDLLPNEYEADVVQNLNVSHQRMLFYTLKPAHAAEILSRVDPDDAVDILLSLPIKRRDAILTKLPQDAQSPIAHLMNLSTSDIGGLATSEFFAASPEENAGNVKRRMKKTTAVDMPIVYVYVINKKNELAGVFTLHELLLQDNETPVYKFMTPNVVSTYLTTPPELAIKKMIKYKISALPLVNEHRHILGIITIDDLLETVEHKLL